MSLYCVNTKIIISSVLIILFLFSTGCTEKLKPDSTEQQISPLDSPVPAPSSQSSVSVSPIQNQTRSSLSTTIVTVTPHFYGTISYGSNRSSALTEDQAWEYAEAFFSKAGIRDIQPSEIISGGQGIWKENDTQKMVWSFRVNRMKQGVNYGGVIWIDAFDGHVVSYGGFL
jgi:hypothetical protein